jgi:AcrR family transcriptional regulator
MGAVERREREKAEFREQVLRAARKIVLKEGFEALSMRKIADAIEYAPGTIYLYFKSRDDIAAELTHRGFEELLRALEPAARLKDPAERLERLGPLYVRFAVEHPETYRLIFMESYTEAVFDAKDSSGPGEQALQILIDAFDELRAQGRLAGEGSSKQLADVFWCAVHGIASLKLTCRERYPETPTKELVSAMGRTLLRGILKG